MSHHAVRHPYSSMLRRRAAHLRELASSIESSLVMRLTDAPALAAGAAWTSPQARLCGAALDRNLHQLHRAADDLRDLAFQISARATELDAGASAVSR